MLADFVDGQPFLRCYGDSLELVCFADVFVVDDEGGGVHDFGGAGEAGEVGDFVNKTRAHNNLIPLPVRHLSLHNLNVKLKTTLRVNNNFANTYLDDVPGKDFTLVVL